ncbi:hypothetical protein [Enterocloster bolteae]|uniref:Uncharacterized protein n=1 Tax=Enterocloster bolteae (strain ATCC BAA-613 / DSM 15670 / CCUG 46953 / JCM 12243 / WAL 16351) TaxID=411902 RepID=A8RHP9_ENTBW|nr:hypothetical protein [Enterocloster bolteae]EDP19036.1 hypothetical protein CLOBOL_00472 [Enterocloster bolteae ATCC BAA-613]
MGRKSEGQRPQSISWGKTADEKTQWVGGREEAGGDASTGA